MNLEATDDSKEFLDALLYTYVIKSDLKSFYASKKLRKSLGSYIEEAFFYLTNLHYIKHIRSCCDKSIRLNYDEVKKVKSIINIGEMYD